MDAAPFGTAACFGINGLSFLVVIAALFALRLPPLVLCKPAARQRDGSSTCPSGSYHGDEQLRVSNVSNRHDKVYPSVTTMASNRLWPQRVTGTRFCQP